jgi:uncharacterized protein
MLEVTFYRDSRQRLSSIFARGHAEFADHGEDLVCAAVSAILQAARLGLEQHEHLDLGASQEPGLLRIHVPAEARDREGVVAILTTARLSVRQLAAQFPGHVTAGEIGDDDGDATPDRQTG